MRQVMVRYRVKPSRAAENEELVRAVYEELHRTRPPGFRYATYQLDDGASFVHLATESVDNATESACGAGGVSAIRQGHRRAMRRSARGHDAARDRVLPLTRQRVGRVPRSVLVASGCRAAAGKTEDESCGRATAEDPGPPGGQRSRISTSS